MIYKGKNLGCNKNASDWNFMLFLISFIYQDFDNKNKKKQFRQIYI